MTNETLNKANELKTDIDNIAVVLSDNANHKWIRVIGARHENVFYSTRFQEELAKWLETKLEQYEKELDEL